MKWDDHLQPPDDGFDPPANCPYGNTWGDCGTCDQKESGCNITEWYNPKHDQPARSMRWLSQGGKMNYECGGCGIKHSDDDHVCDRPTIASADYNETWPIGCVQRAFVDGAAWARFEITGFTPFPSEYDEAEEEAVRRYGEPS